MYGGRGKGGGAIYRFPVIIQSVSLQNNPPIYVCIQLSKLCAYNYLNCPCYSLMHTLYRWIAHTHTYLGKVILLTETRVYELPYSEKVSWISLLCGNSWKFSPQNFGAWHYLAAPASTPRKFSPRKIYFHQFVKVLSRESFPLCLDHSGRASFQKIAILEGHHTFIVHDLVSMFMTTYIDIAIQHHSDCCRITFCNRFHSNSQLIQQR